MKRNLFLTAIMVLTLASCSQKPTMQKYFVEKSEQKDFMTLDIAPNFINTDSINLSPEEKTALKSLHKLNILAYKATPANKQQYTSEKEKVKALIKGEYEELMKVNMPEQGVSINTKGEGEHIEEFVVYAYNKDNGFTVVRVLGEDMNPTNIMTMVGLLQKGDLNLSQLEPLKNMLQQK